MNNTVLRILSAVLALGAVAVAILAIRLSQNPTPAPVVVTASAPAAPTEAVAMAARSLKAGQPVVAGDVAVKGMASPPALAYRQIQDVVGRAPIADVPVGAPLLPSMFAADSIAYLLKPGERAVGVEINEVTGVGGFAKPGEHVDVLGFLPRETESNTVGSAVVVVEDARLLSLGDTTKLDIDAAAPNNGGLADALAKESGVKAAAEMKERRLRLKSAVLAVRESEVNKLMLAASVGSVRLALRPPVAVDMNGDLGQGGRKNTATKAAPVSASDMGIQREGTRRSAVIIQEGSTEIEPASSSNTKGVSF